MLDVDGWLSAELLGPNKSPQWANCHQTLPLFPSWTLHQLSVPGLTTSIDLCSIIRLATPRVRPNKMFLTEIKSSMTKMCFWCFLITLLSALWNLSDKGFLSLSFHSRIFNRILLPTYRTLGQYHHQAFAASWSQSTEGEGLGARVNPGTDTLNLAWEYKNSDIRLKQANVIKVSANVKYTKTTMQLYWKSLKSLRVEKTKQCHTVSSVFASRDLMRK